MSSLAEFEPLLADNKLVFFPEYTDHGPDHVREVLIAADAIIRDEAWDWLTPEDAAALILAVLLHDCAMHLSEDGFFALRRSADWSQPARADLDDRGWPALWTDYFREASRFDDRQLRKLFGNTEPILRDPPLDANALTRQDRQLIGEFLRRHHARLAHEIALLGFPGPTQTPLKLKGVDARFGDLVGLIARSHGVPLRVAVDQLEENDRPEHLSVHAPFVMAVLRIADYLQIQRERAPGAVLNVKTLKSPISTAEWKKHDAIVHVHPWHRDPESLYIKAEPSNGTTYVAIQRLLKGIQVELDHVWATLGEIYGRIPELASLGLVLRRIRSSLDNEQAFARSVEFVPGGACFESAGANLLKLMVGPLYGNDPAVGIRELLQNAVDACLELEDYLKTSPPRDRPKFTHQDGDVVITLERDASGVGSLTVSDRGIGMTPDVVKSYFLKAGASFRNSDMWRAQHADCRGESRVMRSGRFGVGALATFLLGDEIDVSTRHISEARGVQFRAGIDNENIELRYCEREVGTTITVPITDPSVFACLCTHNEYRWDWYRLAQLTVVRRLVEGDKITVFPQNFKYPAERSQLPEDWYRVEVDGFADVHWQHNGPDIHFMDRGNLTCNGIHFAGQVDWCEDYETDVDVFSTIRFKSPRLSIFDRDGRLAVNLQRSSARTDTPLFDAVYDDICKDFIAYALVCVPGEPSEIGGFPIYEGCSDTQQEHPPLFVVGEGWSCVDAWHIEHASLTSVHVFSRPGPVWKKTVGSTPMIWSKLKRPLLQHAWYRLMTGGGLGKYDGGYGGAYDVGVVAHLSVDGRRLLLPRAVQNRLAGQTSAKALMARMARTAEAEWSNSDWVLFKSGNCPDSKTPMVELAETCSGPNLESVAELYLAKPVFPLHKQSRFARIWEETVGAAVVPFNIDERRRLLAGAFEKLAPHVAKYEKRRG